MVNSTVDKRFALIASNGDVLNPYMKTQKSTGRYGFALSKTGDRDAKSGGEYVETIEQLVRKVVFDGYKVRVKTTHKSSEQRTGSLKIGGRAIVGYWISGDLQHLVIGAPTAPMELSKF